MFKKGKHLDDNEVVIYNDIRGVSGNNVDYREEIIELPNYKKKTKNILKVTISYFIFAVLAIVGVYVGVAGTLMVATPLSESHAESHVWIQRNKFPGGIPTIGQPVFASITEAAPTDFVGKVLQGFVEIPNSGIFLNIAGPNGEVHSQDNAIFFKGEPTGFNGTINENNVIDLKRQYLMLCVSGDCNKDSYYLVPRENIIGEPTHYVSFMSPSVKKITVSFNSSNENTTTEEVVQ